MDLVLQISSVLFPLFYSGQNFLSLHIHKKSCFYSQTICVLCENLGLEFCISHLICLIDQSLCMSVPFCYLMCKCQSLPYHLWKPYTAKSLQLCPTLCNPIDGSPSGSPVPGILQARTLEWVAISFSNAWKWKMKVKLLSHVRLLATPWTAAYQAPPSMGFSRQEDWSGVPLPSPLNTV